MLKENLHQGCYDKEKSHKASNIFERRKKVRIQETKHTLFNNFKTKQLNVI